MSKIPQLVIEPYLLEPLPKENIIKSMTNKSYRDNILNVRRVIVQKQKEYERAYQRIKDIPINWPSKGFHCNRWRLFHIWFWKYA